MIWKDLIKYFISFVTIYLIFNQYGNNIYNILILIDIRYILLIIFLSFIQYMISAYRWMYISRFTNLDINFFYSLKFYYISSFMNNILGNADKYMDFKRLVKSGRGLRAEAYFDYLNSGWRREYLQAIYDQHMMNNPGSNDRIYKNLQRLFKL